MTIVVQDLHETEAWDSQGGAPIPVGEWLAVIDNVEEGRTSNQSPQLVIHWRALEGEARDATSREWLVVLPQTYGKVKAFLEALAYPIPPGQFALPTTQLVGRQCRIVVRDDQFDGKTTRKVMGHLPKRLASPDIPIDRSDFVSDQRPADDDTDPLPF